MTARYLIDNSALARMNVPSVASRMSPLIEQGLAATCAMIDLEVLYSAQSARDYETIRTRRALVYEHVEVDDGVFLRALDVQRALARRGQHRLPIPDLLIAATAEAAGLVVLHYDADFDRIASVTGQVVEWVVPRGSV